MESGKKRLHRELSLLVLRGLVAVLVDRDIEPEHAGPEEEPRDAYVHIQKPVHQDRVNRGHQPRL